jgi:hypothetical protein
MICFADSERAGAAGRGFADTHHEISGRAPVTKKNLKQHLKVLQVDMKDAKAALQKAEKKKEPVMQHHSLLNFLFSLQAVWYLVEKLLQNKHVKAAVIYFDVKSHKEWRATHPSDPRIQSFSHAAVTEEIALYTSQKEVLARAELLESNTWNAFRTRLSLFTALSRILAFSQLVYCVEVLTWDGPVCYADVMRHARVPTHLDFASDGEDTVTDDDDATS